MFRRWAANVNQLSDDEPSPHRLSSRCRLDLVTFPVGILQVQHLQSRPFPTRGLADSRTRGRIRALRCRTVGRPEAREPGSCSGVAIFPWKPQDAMGPVTMVRTVSSGSFFCRV